MMLTLMLLSLAAQGDKVPLSGGLPQSPTFRTTTELTCEGEGKYVFVVENRGFRLAQITATLNGEPVELKSLTGTLQGSVQLLRDITVEPIMCRGGSGAAVRVWGIGRVPSSSTFGERVALDFQAEINCERRRVIYPQDMGCSSEGR
ncbi:MAG TPA: hypothetical protein VF620_03210 [Allosphingosinicella sp.]